MLTTTFCWQIHVSSVTRNASVDTHSPSFIKNAKRMQGLVNTLRKKTEVVLQGGGEKAVARHRARGKMLPRERIDRILDPGSPFFELSPLAGDAVYPFPTPSAGIVTGIGRVHNHHCMFIANDATVKGGTYFPLTIKKHLRAQELASKMQLPCIYLVDSGGIYLPLQHKVFPDKMNFGRVFYNQARMSSRGIMQLACVFGSSVAGGAYLPAMADTNIIINKNGHIFLGGPELVKSATGEKVTADELGGAKVHTEQSGVCDYFASNEEEGCQLIRRVIGTLPEKKIAKTVYKEPKYQKEELNGIVPFDDKVIYDPRLIIERIVDDSQYLEFKKDYGKTLVCCFAKLKGRQIGILANYGILFSDSSLKGAHFIQLCEKRNIPLLFMHNITGFMIGKKAERNGIAKDGAKLVTAVSCASVPKVGLVVGHTHGAGTYAMAGRAYADVLVAWPSAAVAVMGKAQAADVLTALSKKSNVSSLIADYEQKSTAFYSTAHLWDDGIIEPADTRDTIAFAFDVCESKRRKVLPSPIYRM